MSERYNKNTSIFKFYQVPRKERLDYVKTELQLNEKSFEIIESGLKDFSIGENLIEGFLTYFEIPLGLSEVIHFQGKSIRIPLAVEESSVIAALNKSIKLFNNTAKVEVFQNTKEIKGHCYFKYSNENFLNETSEQLNELSEFIQSEFPTLKKYNLGEPDLKIFDLNIENQKILKLEIKIKAQEIMGANLITQICEKASSYIMKQSRYVSESVMNILSNNSSQESIKLKVKFSNFPNKRGEKIQLASQIAETDLDRAVTHNKGIMNAIEPLIIVSGNDSRANNAHIYSQYAQRKENFSFSKWRQVENDLIGEISLPLQLGLKGGMTSLHPMSQIALKLLGEPDTSQFMSIIAIAGLLQNFSALDALTNKGIIAGHMNLHISNAAILLECTNDEALKFTSESKKYLKNHGKFSPSIGKKILDDIRKTGS